MAKNTNGAVVAETEESFLPVPLEIEVRGEVVTSNAEAFRAIVREWVSGFNTALVEDEDFARADQDVKKLKAAEDAVKGAKEKALEDAEQLNTLFKLLDDTSEEVRQARLGLERQVKAKKEEIRATIISDAVEAIVNGHGPKYRREIEDAIKNKRTLESMRTAVDVVVTTANATIEGNAATLDEFEKKHGRELVPDRDKLETIEGDGLSTELRHRLQTKKAEDERRRLEEEAAQARREAEEARRQAEAASAPPEPVMDVPPDPEADLFQQPPVANHDPAYDTDAATEFEAFRAQVLTAFGPLKTARQSLKHPANIERAARFAGALNDAWKALNQ